MPIMALSVGAVQLESESMAQGPQLQQPIINHLPLGLVWFHGIPPGSSSFPRARDPPGIFNSVFPAAHLVSSGKRDFSARFPRNPRAADPYLHTPEDFSLSLTTRRHELLRLRSSASFWRPQTPWLTGPTPRPNALNGLRPPSVRPPPASTPPQATTMVASVPLGENHLLDFIHLLLLSLPSSAPMVS